MKTLLFLIPSLAARGAERALVNLVNNLDKSRYRITVQTLFDVGPLRKELSPEVEYRLGLPWLIRGNVPFLKLFSPKFLYKVIVRKRYDIAIAYLEGVPTRILSGCPYSDTKLIAWHHTCFPTAQDFAYCYRNPSEARFCYSRFSRLVSVSDVVHQSVHLWTKRSCQVIHNVVEESRILRLAAEPVANIAFPLHPKLFSIGALEPVKGYDRILSVHARLLHEGFLHTLYIIGEGTLRADLERQIQQLGISSTVVLLGQQSNPYRYLRHADLYVCSSHQEGLSTAVTEALVLGKPVVSTDCGGARELLGNTSQYGIVTQNSEHGLYEGLLRMLSSQETLNHYALMASVRASLFSKESVLFQHTKLFADIMS